MTTHKTTKYKLHYRTWHDCKSRTKTYTRLGSAISDLSAFRVDYEKKTREAGMKYYDGSECTEKSLADILNYMRIEEIVTETRVLDY